MTSKEALDEFDKQILDVLQRELEATPNVTKMAAKLQKPTATVHTRIKRLERLGIIKGYRAVLEPTKVEKGVTMFYLLKISAETTPEEVVEALSKHNEVKEIHMISGDWMFLVKLRFPTTEDMYTFEKNMWNKKTMETSLIVSLKSFKEETAHILEF